MIYTALIRTHHITSRKKVAALRAAAKKLDTYVLLRNGGIPGVMYVEGASEANVQAWVDTVHGLRYKDYQLAAAVSPAPTTTVAADRVGQVEEVTAVKDIATAMEAKGLLTWWRKAMGFVHE